MKIAVSGVQESFAGLTGSYFGIIPNNSISNFTLTRALDTATRINKSGVIESVPANVARIDYSLGTNHCPALLVERLIENKISASTNMIGNYWGAGSNVTRVSQDFINCPDGIKITNNANGGINSNNTYSVYRSTFTVQSGFNSFTFYAKKTGSHSTIGIWSYNVGGCYNINFNLDTLIVSRPQTYARYTNREGFIIPLGNNEFLCGETFLSNDSVTNDQISFAPCDNNSNFTTVGNDIAVSCPQITFTSFPLSFVGDGTTSLVTRNADVIQKTGLSSVIPQTAGSLLFDGYLQAGSLSDATSRVLLDISTDTGNRITLYRYNNSITIDIVKSGVSYWSGLPAIVNPIRNKRIKVIANYELNNSSIIINGQTLATDTSVEIPSCSTLSVGYYSGFARYWDGLIKMAGVAEELTETERDQFFQYETFAEMASEMLYTIEE